MQTLPYRAIQRSLRESIFKHAEKEIKDTTKQRRYLYRPPKSPASPKRVERPVNSQDELNIVLRKVAEANRSLFGIKLKSPIHVLMIDKDD